MESAFAWLRRTEPYAKALAALREGGGSFGLAGLFGSARSLVIAAVREDLRRPFACVVPGFAEGDDLASDLASLSPDLPPAKVWPLAGEAGGLSTERESFEALSILRDLASPNPPPLVIGAAALLAAAPAPQALVGRDIPLEVGGGPAPEPFVARLAEARLERVGRVEGPLTYARRGGIVDCYLPARFPDPDKERETPPDAPLRIEWDGDAIRSLRFFDPVTQGSIEPVSCATLTLPAPPGGALSGETTLLAHLQKNAWIALLDPSEINRRLSNLAADPGRSFPWTPGDIERHLGAHARLSLREDSLAAEADASLPVKSLVRFVGDLDAKMRILAELARARRPFFLFARRAADAERVKTLSAERQIDWKGKLFLREGRLARGFELAPDGPIFVSHDEVFHLRAPDRFGPGVPRRARQAACAIEDLAQLKPGDVVVHEREGVAIYRGLARLEKAGSAGEHLKLEFAERTVLYVPVDEIAAVFRYVGAGTEKPALSRLGGQLWKNAKKAATQATRDYAAEFLRLAALRQAHPAQALMPDRAFVQAFDVAFPYPPTDDQERAADAIARDLAGRTPMDRLLTGDVGFGKTEVAMRAAFRAVACGKQVAVLAPTTVLALQHAKSFEERFASFPVKIAMVSRLRTAAQQKKILAEAKAGRIDILIGTHRLLGKDVGFADLGLLIIDEEQKFGVAAKNRLKGLRAALHVLALSATPIPRTLHEALLGIKEISNLATPPLDRHAILTQVARFNEGLIQKAVAEELARGGQVFFVHNRIAGLARMERMLARLAPQARVAVGHGKLPAEKLEEAMLDLAERRADILLSTTIIESGLDFPNVNTLIVSDAHRYGLAELHQLRGRVGRFKRQAYAYLLVPTDATVTPAAMRRLKAIEEFSDLGAGFQVALADLEIRGAGNLLGTEQSGHIAAVGYTLYCQLLSEAARALKGKPAPRHRESARVRLLGEAYLPDGYIPEPEEKFGLYRKLARAQTEAELDAAIAHIVDRFGKPPHAAGRSFAAARLRILATAAGFIAIEEKKDGVELRFSAGIEAPDLAKLFPAARHLEEDVFKMPRPEGWIDRLISALRRMAALSRG